MTMLRWTYHHPNAQMLLGFLPNFIDGKDPLPLKEQIDANYKHGGGWRSFNGFTKSNDDRHIIKYPGDPALHPIARVKVRNELMLVYQYAWVVIVQEDGSWEIAKID